MMPQFQHSSEGIADVPSIVPPSEFVIEHADGGSRDEWNAYVESSQLAEIYHRYEWRDFFESVFGHDCHYLLARDEHAGVCGVLPLAHLKSRLFGNFLVSIPCFNYAGVLADHGVPTRILLDAATSLAQELGASSVELRHRDHIELNRPFRDDKISMQLELPGSEEALWKSFKPKLRSQIRRPKKEGAACVQGGEELVDQFYTVFSRNMRDLGTPVFPKGYFSEMCRRFPDATRIFVVKLQDKPVSAGITLGYRDVLEIPSASSLRQFNRFSPNMLLYWTVVKYGIEHGYKVFDFGRTSRGSGPYRFKKQWGALPKPLKWHYLMEEGRELPRINPDNPKFRLAVNAWRRLPVPLANLISRCVVKYLP